MSFLGDVWNTGSNYVSNSWKEAKKDPLAAIATMGMYPSIKGGITTGGKVASDYAYKNGGKTAEQAGINADTQSKLLSDQKAAADFKEQSGVASSIYGSALGGQNIQSSTNKSGKKSILGAF